MTVRALPATPMLALSCFLMAACGSGDKGGNSGNTGPAPDFSVTAGAVAPTTLGTQATFTVSLASSGFAGPVTLAVSGAPASWAVAISGSPVTLSANGNASATVTVTIPTDGAAAPAGLTLTVRATGSSGSHTSTTQVTVANEYVVAITSGTGGGAHWGTLAGTTIRLNAGTTLTIRNDDASVHRVHANATSLGMQHQAVDMATGGTFSSVLSAGSDTFYCHDHGQATGQVTVTVQ